MKIQDAEVQGWGPDYAEVIVQCPVTDCFWGRTFETDVTTVTIGSLLEAVEAHRAERHPEEGEGK